jgi:hypothetical protein
MEINLFYASTIIFRAGAYLDLLLEGGTQNFSLIQTQNVQIKFLVIFKSGDSLISVVFYFNLMLDPLNLTFM